MGFYNQATTTDAAFVHLRGIHELNMEGCDQTTITGATFEHLRGIRALETDGCTPAVQAAATAVLALGPP